MTTVSTPRPTRPRRRIGLYIISALLVILLAVLAYAVYWIQPMGATAAARAQLRSSSQVQVQDNADYIAFLPSAKAANGMIFYPGAKVDPAAYAEYMHSLADHGYAAFIVKLPLNLALLDTNKAESVIKAYPDIKTWAVGGHSLGGVGACEYVKAHPTVIKGLLLYASYPNSDIAQLKDLHVVSIYGTNDKLATPAKVEDHKALLPASTQYVAINGGIHAFFGDYGVQDGDGQPSISRAQASEQITQASLQLMDALSKAS